jgi:hypothetical protein
MFTNVRTSNLVPTASYIPSPTNENILTASNFTVGCHKQMGIIYFSDGLPKPHTTLSNAVTSGDREFI